MSYLLFDTNFSSLVFFLLLRYKRFRWYTPSIFLCFYQIFKVLVNIRTIRKFKYSLIILYDYNTLSYQSFDTNFSSLELLVAELLTFSLVYPLHFSVIFPLNLKLYQYWKKQESQNVCVSYLMVTEHNPSNDLIPISAL